MSVVSARSATISFYDQERDAVYTLADLGEGDDLDRRVVAVEDLEVVEVAPCGAHDDGPYAIHPQLPASAPVAAARLHTPARIVYTRRLRHVAPTGVLPTTATLAYDAGTEENTEKKSDTAGPDMGKGHPATTPPAPQPRPCRIPG